MYPRTVLLVDADRDCRTVFATMLEHHGYQVLQAGDGELAWRLAAAHSPDLIIVELAIPGLSGVMLMQRLRQDQRTAQTPVLVISSRVLAHDRERASVAGCAAFLPKPCRPRRMLKEVQRFIGSSSLAVA